MNHAKVIASLEEIEQRRVAYQQQIQALRQQHERLVLEQIQIQDYQEAIDARQQRLARQCLKPLPC